MHPQWESGIATGGSLHVTRSRPRPFRRALPALVAAAALTATACGSAASPESSAPSRPPVTLPSLDTPAPGPAPGPVTVPPAASASVLPAVEVIEVATGRTVNLETLAPSSRPVLLWFWAPH